MPVECGERFFWAYDVGLGVLLSEALSDAPPELQDHFQAQIAMGANHSFEVDSAAASVIVQAGRRLGARGRIPKSEISEKYGYGVRFEEFVEGAVLEELAGAIDRLVRDDLPPSPEEGKHWFYGAPGGPRLL